MKNLLFSFALCAVVSGPVQAGFLGTIRDTKNVLEKSRNSILRYPSDKNIQYYVDTEYEHLIKPARKETAKLVVSGIGIGWLVAARNMIGCMPRSIQCGVLWPLYGFTAYTALKRLYYAGVRQEEFSHRAELRGQLKALNVNGLHSSDVLKKDTTRAIEKLSY